MKVQLAKRSNYGFTIVELLIVVVVIGILASITIVAFQGMNARAQKAAVESESAQLAKELKLAAVEAGSCNFLTYYVSPASTAYYNKTLTTAPIAQKRCEQSINLLDYGGDYIPSPVPVDDVAAYWRSVITVPATGSYTFYASCDDDQRLYINNKLVIESGLANDVTYTATYAANEKLLLRYEMREGYGGARGRLEWTGPNLSRSLVVPGV